MRLHSEKQACPRRRNLTALKMALSRCQTERDGKAFGDAEQSDRHLTGCWDSCVASEPFCPREASMGTLRGKGSLLRCVTKLQRETAGSPQCVGAARAAYRRAGVLSDSNPAK